MSCAASMEYSNVIVQGNWSAGGLEGFFRAAFHEEVVGLYLIYRAQGQELHKAGVGFLSRFQPGDIALRNPAARVGRLFRNTRHLTHGQVILFAQFFKYSSELHDTLDYTLIGTKSQHKVA